MPGEPIKGNSNFTGASGTSAAILEVLPAPGSGAYNRIAGVIIGSRPGGVANTVVLRDGDTELCFLDIGGHPNTKVYDLRSLRLVLSENTALKATVLTADTNGPNVLVTAEKGPLYAVQEGW